MERLVPIAEIARPHGVRGELRLKVYNPDTALLGRGREVWLAVPSGAPERRTLQAARPVDGALLVRLSGVDDRDAAEALRGVRLLVPRSAFPPAEEGEFYACDVEGARAELASGEVVGVVRELVEYPTVSVLVVETPAGARLEVPLHEDYVKDVDAEGQRVVLHHVDGLD